MNRPFKLHQIDLLDNILLKESLIIFLLARSLSLVHTCCQIIHLHTHIPLIPVLDSGNGTGTKLILHLPLLPLAFHLPHFSSSLTYSLKRMYLVPNTCAGKKHSLTGHLSTDWNSSNQPIQGGQHDPKSISGAHSSTRQQDPLVLTPAKEGLGASLKEDEQFGSLTNMES